MSSIFSCVCSHLYVFSGEVSVRVFCPFFGWVICFLNVEFEQFFTNLGYQPFICNVICKYLLTFHGLLSFVDCFLKLGGLHNKHLFITVLEAEVSKIKVLADLDLVRALFLACKWPPSGCVLTWPFLGAEKSFSVLMRVLILS